MLIGRFNIMECCIFCHILYIYYIYDNTYNIKNISIWCYLINAEAGRTNLLEAGNVVLFGGGKRGHWSRGGGVEVLMLVVTFYFLAWLVVTWRLFATWDGPWWHPMSPGVHTFAQSLPLELCDELIDSFLMNRRDERSCLRWGWKKGDYGFSLGCLLSFASS